MNTSNIQSVKFRSFTLLLNISLNIYLQGLPTTVPSTRAKQTHTNSKLQRDEDEVQ